MGHMDYKNRNKWILNFQKEKSQVGMWGYLRVSDTRTGSGRGLATEMLIWHNHLTQNPQPESEPVFLVNMSSGIWNLSETRRSNLPRHDPCEGCLPRPAPESGPGQIRSLQCAVSPVSWLSQQSTTSRTSSRNHRLTLLVKKAES